MKKIFVILSMLGYAVSSSGATMYIHYCCGKFDKMDFNSPEKDTSPFRNKFTQKGCCDNKVIEFKIKSEYKAEAEAKHFLKDFKAYISFDYAVFETPLISYRPLHFSGVSPPLSASVPFYILDCVFRI